MTIPADNLDDLLARLTAWPGESPDAWARAATPARHRKHDTGSSSLLSTPISNPALAVLLVVLSVSVLAMLVLPSLSRARSVSNRSNVDMPPASVASAPVDLSASHFSDPASTGALMGRPDLPAEPGFGLTRNARVDADYAPSTVPAPSSLGSPPLGPVERHVVRKASIELAAPDVRAAFTKVSMLLSEASGDYIEQSALTGGGDSVSATLTLRVAAGRLSQVLSGLRELGEVRGETALGEDVTNQVVDLEARLRNEQRVESELLQLLESRKGAPLKEVLELRDSLGRVRLEIERLTGSRERLSRLVSLATVLVMIRSDASEGPQDAEPVSLGEYLSQQIGEAWNDGLRALVSSLAWALNALLSGLLLWITLALMLVGTVVMIRRAKRRAADEPAPVLS